MHVLQTFIRQQAVILVQLSVNLIFKSQNEYSAVIMFPDDSLCCMINI